MHCISDLIDAELGSQGVAVVLSSFFGVVGTAKPAQPLDHFLLAHLTGNDGPTGGHVIGHLIEFRHNTLIELEELASGGLVQVEHLKSCNLKSPRGE